MRKSNPFERKICKNKEENLVESSEKRVILIGLGPNAMRTYIPYFKKYGIRLVCVVDLASEIERIQKILDAGNPGVKTIAVPNECRDDFVLNPDTKREIQRIVEEEHVEYAVVNSEPKSHYAYVLFFLSAGVDILLEKPIIAPRRLDSLDDVACMRRQYEDILAIAEKSRARCMVMCQRRMNYGYEWIRNTVKKSILRYNVPITEIEINHCDGNWMLPQDLFYENHPYHYGYGKLYHSGYHYVDLLAQFISLNACAEECKMPLQAYISTDVQSVGDEMAILPPRDIRRLFHADSLPAIPGPFEERDYSKFGEKNVFSQLAFANDGGKNITVAQLGIGQFGFSRRGWLLAKPDHYKGNGRIRHEYVSIQMGPLMNIRVSSFQSKEVSERTDCEYLSGGLDHFDIEIFRNSSLTGGGAYEKLDCRDILKEKDEYGLHELNEISRVRMLHAFFFDKQNRISDIAAHQLGMKIMMAITEGIVLHKSGDRRITHVDLTRDDLNGNAEAICETTVADLLWKKRFSDKMAIVFGNESITYREWFQQSCAVAREIAKAGVGPRNNIVLVLPNSIHYAVAYFGALFSGNTIVPISRLATKDEILGLIKYCGAAMVLTEKTDSVAISALLTEDARSIPVLAMEDMNMSPEAFSPRFDGDPDDVCIMLHTSGTTSDPKRVMLTNRNLLSNIRSHTEALGLCEDDVTMILLPMHFGYCNTSQFLTHLYLGGTIVINADGEKTLFPKRFWKKMIDFRITNITLVPSVLVNLYKAGRSAVPDGAGIPLRYICYGGGRSNPDTISGLVKMFPEIGLVHTYGQTECSPRVTMLAPEDALKKPGSVGKPLRRVEVRVLSPDGKTLAATERGEICVRGANVMKGYYLHPDLTADTIRDGWLHTGDEGCFDEDGYLYVCGRLKSMIIFNGINIYPEEIENILVMSDMVRDAVVYGVPDELYGEVVEADIIAESGYNEPILRRYCAERLSSYKIPKVFHKVTSIEKTFNNKNKRFLSSSEH